MKTNEILETVLKITLLLAYSYNLIYAFMFHGSGWGLLNIALPCAVLVDTVLKFGQIK